MDQQCWRCWSESAKTREGMGFARMSLQTLANRDQGPEAWLAEIVALGNLN